MCEVKGGFVMQPALWTSLIHLDMPARWSFDAAPQTTRLPRMAPTRKTPCWEAADPQTPCESFGRATKVNFKYRAMQLSLKTDSGQHGAKWERCGDPTPNRIVVVGG